MLGCKRKYKLEGKVALAEEFAGKGITVNAVAPGFVDTDMVKSVPDEAMKSILSKIPLGKLGKASEIAGLWLTWHRKTAIT